AAIRVRLAQLENDLHKARAIREIKRLQYSYAHCAELGLWFDLGDLFAANGVAHYAQGDFRGPESLRKFYLQELGCGQLGLADGRIYPHIMIQPVVSVAADGRTAKGRWHVIEAERGSALAEFVKAEFEAFLACGILAHGFLRLRCSECGHEKLVAFSCKRRGFCPSFGVRRMAQ